MCPIYQYKHPETEEIFETIRSFKDANKVFIAPDGKKCKRVKIPINIRGWKGNREVFAGEENRGY